MALSGLRPGWGPMVVSCRAPLGVGVDEPGLDLAGVLASRLVGGMICLCRWLCVVGVRWGGTGLRRVWCWIRFGMVLWGIVVGVG